MGDSNDNSKNPVGDVTTSKADNQEAVHMLIFETDEPHPETKDRKGGGFAKVFDELFTKAGSEHDPPLSIETSMHYVVDDPDNGHNGHVPNTDEIPESIKAILITGSMYDAHGNDKWVKQLLSLLEEVWTKRPDVLLSGVCFGHQILSRMLGSKVEGHPSGKWELAHTEMSLTPVGQKLFRTDDKKLSLHQMHQDQVTTKPSSETTSLLKEGQKVHVWASTEHTEIQGLYIRDRLFTTQGHLGFDEQMVRRQIEMREESGSIEGDETERAAEAKESAHLKHDGEVVAAAILRFFHGDDHDVD
ncbi:hypothetical protein LTS08_005225 [Lithohypha guttulata]|uniref:uncharacterized protein n=1 Tax=Lithohypha guttulata TaxID=1690604 RepID=UPI002DDE9B4B|nr:hypothetical protein LTR51_004859 [Lithohypha guttulata]KAK5100476.1 hypothetical protein LTS08_005225 [Lithohypha guttulata]